MIDSNKTADLACINSTFTFREQCKRNSDFKMLHERMVANSDLHNIIDTMPFQLTIFRYDGNSTLHTFPKGFIKISSRAECQITLQGGIDNCTRQNMC